jgi:putative FmdB family regulatory protein
MPTYEYRCSACQHEFDKLQKMSDKPEAPCPVCGSPAERLLSGGAGLLFKGSGFYITDYRSDSYKKAARSEKSGGARSDASPAGSSSPKSE